MGLDSGTATQTDIVGLRLAKVIAAIALLNLNGFAYMLLGIGQVFSLAMLACGLWLLLRSPRLRINTQLLLFFIAMGAYLVFGLVFIAIFRDRGADLWQTADVFSAVLLIIGLTAHIQKMREHELEDFLRFVRNLVVFSALMTLASPLLYSIYLNPPPSYESRFAGLFANPNETGRMCVLAYIMLTWRPLRPIAQHVVLGLVLLCALATFSRAAILAILLILAISVFQARAWVRVVVMPIVLSAMIIIATNPMMIVDGIKRQELVQLDQQQEARLETSVLAATGEIDTETSNGRTDMIEISIERAMEMFPLGSGLGTFHHIRGGIMGLDDWLGSHNFFLMAWGESGFLVLVLFVALFVAMLIRSPRSVHPWATMYLVLLLLMSALTGHDLISARYLNVVMAMVLGMPAAVYARRSAQRMPMPA